MKKLSLSQVFLFTLVGPGVLVLLLLGSTLGFGLAYSFSQSLVHLILLIVFDTLFIAGFVVSLVFGSRYLRKVYVEGIYNVSSENIDKLSQGQNDLASYPNYKLTEIEELNKRLDVLRERWRVSSLYSRHVDYDALGVPYIDKEHHLTDDDFLINKLGILVHASEAFTVGLLSLHYDMGKETLNEEEKKRILSVVFSYFSFIPSALYAFGKEGRSLLCYLPGIDSMRIIREKVSSFAGELSVSKRLPEGMKFFAIKAAMVCYPHSSVADMWTDLLYARRQPDTLTFFLPDRKKTRDEGFLLNQHEDNVAFFNKILLPIRHLPGKGDDEEIAVLKRVYEAVGDYIGADFRNLIRLEKTTNKYYPFFDDRSEKAIDSDLVNKVISIVDEDNSFYFSSRSSCSEEIARTVDDLGVQSGFIYALYNGEQCIGVLYYGRTSGDMSLDSYMKEALLRLGEAYTDYFFLREKEARASYFQRESEHILGISSYMIYKVDDANLNLTYFSPNLKYYFPRAETGIPCHKALYGLEKQCSQCPLRTYAKMVGEEEVAKKGSVVRNVNLETSLTLNDEKSHERSLLVELVDKNAPSGDAYDHNWLTYSFATLFHQLNDAFLVHSRGYVLLLRLDNIDHFISLQGSEGANFAIRSFIHDIKDALQTQDVYAYNPSTIGILLPRIGHVEIIDVCEKIYGISKRHRFENVEDDRFTLTYLPLGYPRGHANANDFLSDTEEFYHNGDYQRNKDFIFFRDHSISRSASKKDHILSVIDQVFATKTASCVVLQPMVQAGEKKIFGAEVLLRVEDTQRHNFFRADELSRIAEENDRIAIITESLLNFVGDLYKEHGSSVFALNSFRRIAINVDASFLKDTSLSQKVQALYTEQKLGKDFLSFEVPEDLIGEGFKTEGNVFADSGALLVCDRYTGRFVSLNKLKKYGFREVKLPREMINGIEIDAKKLEALADIVNGAKDLGMKVSVVGVENDAQYRALMNLDPTMLMQGYYFYKPLSRSDLINAIVRH